MPFRLNENRARVQFVTSASMPALVHRAAEVTGLGSNTAYYQHALCEALSRDLGIPLEDLIDTLPDLATNSKVLFGGDRRPVRRSQA
jgi:hypothetical protein